MIILILSLLNSIFMKIYLLKILIALVLFIIAEVSRRNGNSSIALIVGQIISGVILLGGLLLFILGIIAKFR